MHRFESMSRSTAVTPASPSKLGWTGAACTLAGAILSGPGAMLVVELSYPQPSWRGAEAFVERYHPVQALPYFLGFLLVGGFVLLIAALHADATKRHRARSGAALSLAGAFAALIGLNYVLQTTFVPALVGDFTTDHAPILAAVTMANPRSLGWALEMWGYAVLGAATWLVAPVFEGRRMARAARLTFVANGPASIVPAILTAFEPGWALGVLGLISFVVWNLLVIAMTVSALIWFRRIVPAGSTNVATAA
jgi:hypothetical protein